MSSMEMVDVEKLISVSDVAKHFEVPTGVVRRAARRGEFPEGSCFRVVGKHGFDPEKVLAWVPPAAGTRRVGVKRADGRQRFSIYLNDEEKAGLDPKFEITNPRAKAAARRAAKKLAADEATTTDEATPEAADASVEVEDVGNPFEEFGTED